MFITGVCKHLDLFSPSDSQVYDKIKLFHFIFFCSHKSSTGLTTDDMRMLNSAIGKLYRHLQLNQREQEMTSSEFTFREPTQQKENVNILTLSQVQPDESFHDIVLKLRNFEKEFQRQKVQQQRELMRCVH